MGLSDDWVDVGGEKRIDFYLFFLYVVSLILIYSHFSLLSRGFIAETLYCPECFLILAMSDH